MAIIWLASFPKSGNTWLRAFLANYFADPKQPLRLEALRTFGYADAQAWPYLKLSGKSPLELSEGQAAALRPRAHALLARSSPDHVLVKTHNAIGAAGGVSTITRQLTIGGIYVIRNVWDVAVSYADHYGMSHDDTITAFNAPMLRLNPSQRHVTQYLSTWCGHAASWMQADFDRLIVRYEDLVARPHATFGKITHFLGLPPDSARLDRAIRFSSFDELSGQEAAEGFEERSRHAERFFRRGRVGGWRDILNPDQAARLAADHRDVLREFGYLDGSDRPFRPT